MRIDRRRFFETAALGAGSLAVGCSSGGRSANSAAEASGSSAGNVPDVIKALKPM